VTVADSGYIRTGIVEYDDNPLINRLPPVPTLRSMYKDLERLPPCEPHERSLPPHLRQQLVVLRLKKAFIPTTDQAVLGTQLHLLIRSGYDGVALGDLSYAGRLAEQADQAEAGKSPRQLTTRFRPTAYSGKLIGPSGMGKTTIINRVLERLPQVVRHSEPVTVDQIVHLRLECPSTGSPKQLCLSFFAEVDALIGTAYYKKFGGQATEHMVLRMAQVAQLHRLGLLVVDEIQYLRSAKIAKDDVLNLLTTLVNVINVPVLMVGTMAAVPLLTSTFRNARRGEGHASAIFEPMKQGPEWERFLDVLFRLQWTREVTLLSPQLADALWDESQGIVDIVIKIFMLAQLRLMRRSETRPVPEIITPGLIRTIGKEDLRLIRPMLRALANKSKSLAKYDDLRPLEEHFGDLLSSLMSSGSGVELPATEPRPAAQSPGREVDLHAALKMMGYAPDVATMLIAEARKKVSSDDPTLLLIAVTQVAKGYEAEATAKPPRRKKVANEPAVEEATDPLDLRTAAGGATDPTDVHAAMARSGTAGGISGAEG
jgi:AAA domain-containing protein